METACYEAIRLSLPEICFTEHVDFVRGDESTGYFDPDAYFAEIDRCRALFKGRLTIRAGAEVGESHRFRIPQERLTGSYPFDFVLGSLHWVGADSAMEPAYFTGQPREQAYGRYFEELLVLARTGDFDALTHLDVPKRYEFPSHGAFDSAEFAEQIREVLNACIERGVGIELNTGSMRRTVSDPSPSPEVLGWYRDLGGEILTLGSDAHRPVHMAHEFDRAVAMIQAAGFTYLTTFDKRQPRFVRIP